MSKVSDQDAAAALIASAEAASEKSRAPPPDEQVNERKRKRPKREKPLDPSQDYYGPGGPDSGSMKNDEDDDEPTEPKEKPNFAVSGVLMQKDMKKGNVYKGVVLKFREPPEARAPTTLWRFHVFKGEKQLEVLHVSKQSAYLIGRNTDICDIPIAHGSSSSQHAVLQYRAMPIKNDARQRPQDPPRLVCQPYIMDLESTNGTFVNGVRIDSARYYQLKKGDVLKFGASTREFVLLTANTTKI